MLWVAGLTHTGLRGWPRKAEIAAQAVTGVSKIRLHLRTATGTYYTP